VGWHANIHHRDTENTEIHGEIRIGGLVSEPGRPLWLRSEILILIFATLANLSCLRHCPSRHTPREATAALETKAVPGRSAVEEAPCLLTWPPTCLSVIIDALSRRGTARSSQRMLHEGRLHAVEGDGRITKSASGDDGRASDSSRAKGDFRC
jgi:hypothetical protein